MLVTISIACENLPASITTFMAYEWSRGPSWAIPRFSPRAANGSSLHILHIDISCSLVLMFTVAVPSRPLQPHTFQRSVLSSQSAQLSSASVTLTAVAATATALPTNSTALFWDELHSTTRGGPPQPASFSRRHERLETPGCEHLAGKSVADTPDSPACTASHFRVFCSWLRDDARAPWR